MVRNVGFYEKHIKRVLDIVCAISLIVLFVWLYALIAVLVRIKLGSPVLFVQPRPGKNEKIFNMYKFRTMTDEKGADGKLLPDEKRLTAFGKKLRETSLDELPEAFNILKGDMSFIGPRPLLVRDMVFMTPEQRMRHTVRPGLSGLAQVNGRNSITWDEKLRYDLEYINDISFVNDVKIFINTIFCSLLAHEGINENGKATADDLGDYLLHCGKITSFEYMQKQNDARQLLSNANDFNNEDIHY